LARSCSRTCGGGSKVGLAALVPDLSLAGVQVELKSQSESKRRRTGPCLQDRTGLDSFNALRAVGSRAQEEREKSLKESERDKAQEG
jgi:hypothetical protein